MPTVGADLNWCQRFLKDTPTPGTDGVLWTRAELLGYYNDGYRTFVRDGGAQRRYTILDVPPRWTYTITHAWEERYAQGGTTWAWTHGAEGPFACSSLFEIQTTEGYGRLPASEGISQGWERSFLNPANTPFRFGLPRNHLRVVRMWYNHRLLVPLETRELDWTYQNWYSMGNYPLAWSVGVGDRRSYDLYEVQTTDTHDYALFRDSQYANTVSDGALRYAQGARSYAAEPDPQLRRPATIGYAYTTVGDAQAITLSRKPDARVWLLGSGLRLTGDLMAGNRQAMFTWEAQQVAGSLPKGLPGVTQAAGETAETKPQGCYPWEVRYGAAEILLPLGVARAIESPDRQYWPVVAWADQQPLGKIDDLKSSNALLVLEAIEPDTPRLLFEDTPGMIPPQLQKYLRFYVLYRAFNRQGPGYMPSLAGAWLARYRLGLQTLQRFADLQRRDKTSARTQVPARTRLPYPRLPGAYPAVWR